MAPLRTYQPFLDLMASMTNPLLGILIGAIFTAVVQSSSATLGVIIALASQGLIPLEAGIALVFGANIGTTITGLLATIGQPRTALACRHRARQLQGAAGADLAAADRPARDGSRARFRRARKDWRWPNSWPSRCRARSPTCT